MGRSNPRIQGNHQADREGKKIRRYRNRAHSIFQTLKKIAFSLSILFFASSAFANAKVYKRTTRFIDIEAPASDVFVYCDPLNQEEKRSLIVIIVLENKKKVHELIYPRLEDHPECVKAEKDHRALIKGAATVRVAGMTIDATSEETRVERLPPGTPKKFGALMERTFWNFIRMETKNGCLAYFPENCKLPENYSAGLDLNAK